ncbi:fungal-specific transcription factor domain-containing protein [Plectosphaerella plurivora]|uniref:Fungal-specific transcription factor domain-containing protein n=1 Tax=Plectosphaerella plurivora TaxID=936078 RepID=A0A9P9ABK8_9PEZI|nr:fungal-specific transcription factor domain-containing protein [Plectosphaerella plurivora]
MNLQWALPDLAEQRRSAGTIQPSGPNGGVQKKVPGKRRGKTFTGCWTCRSRHVKCDEGRPFCKRCLVGDFECQGYEKRLTWVSEPDNTTSAGRRGAKDAEGVALADITIRNGPKKPTSSESTASSTPPAIARRSKPSNRQVTARRAPQNSSTFEWIIEEGSSSSEHAELFGVSIFHPEAPGTDRSSSPTTSEPLWTLGTDYQSIRDTSTSPGAYSIRPGYIGDPSMPITDFSAPSNQRALINHWVTNLAHKLVPVRTAVNPLLTVASPMALQGSRVRPGQTSSTAAVFHAICALSATHQENLKGGSNGDSVLVRYHHRLSFQHLMNNINSTDIDERMASLSTLCIWLLSHFVSGTTGAWRELVRVTRNLLEETSMDTWTRSVTASLTYQSFASSLTLVQSQYMGQTEFPRPFKTDQAGTSITNSLAMPDTSLQLISDFNMKLLSGTTMNQEDMDQLEMEFALTTPPASTDTENDKPDSAMMHHHRLLFYFASLLYFRCNSNRRGSEDEVQSLVARCLDHLEYLDSLQLDISPRAWVFAAVAFEAGTPESRDRVRRSLSKRKGLGISSWDTLRLATEEVWRVRDCTLPGDVPEPWTHMLPRMPEYDVILY